MTGILVLGLVFAGCSTLTNITTPGTTQEGFTYLAKGGPTEDDADSYPLYAGQDELVGEVLVWDDGENLYVKYVVDSPWLLYETHLAIGTSLDDIPTNNAGNPKVGNFPYGDDELDGESSYQECIPLEDILGENDPCGQELVIAAHAVVKKVIGSGSSVEETLYLTDSGVAGDGAKLYQVEIIGGAANLTLLYTLPNPNFDQVDAIACTPDGTTIYVIDKNIRPRQFGKYEVLSGDFHELGGIVIGPDTGNVVAAAFSPDGKLYVYHNGDESLYEVDIDLITAAKIKTVDVVGVTDIVFDFEGKLYLNSPDAGLWKMEDLSSNAVKLGDAIPGTYITGLAIREGGIGSLVGSDRYNSAIVEISKVDGSLIASYTTDITYSGGGDMTVGALGEPVYFYCEETAWGAVCEGETRFVDRGNWATYFNYIIECSSLCIPGSLWIIGDKEVDQMDNPADEFNYPGAPLSLIEPAYDDPFVVGTSLISDFPWNSNWDRGYAVDFDVDFYYSGPEAKAKLTISWSPGKSDEEQKEVFLDGISIGLTPVRNGVGVPGWYEGNKVFQDTFDIDNLTEGNHTLTFKHYLGDGTLWDYVELERVCE